MKKIAILGALGFFPSFAFAANVQSILVDLGDIISLATPIIVALALVFFFYGLAKYILHAGDEEKRAEGRSVMIWGIIALFVIVSVWGLVRVVSDTFGINREQTVDVPFVNLP